MGSDVWFSINNLEMLQRQSNIELLRIIAMLLIIAHHLVVHSGLLAQFGPIYSNPAELKSQCALILGAFGKTGINVFVLISGYFYAKKEFHFEKYAKLFLEVLFYRVLIHIIFLCAGFEHFTTLDYIKIVIPFSTIGTLFIDSYLAFLLFIPFLSKLVSVMNQKQHRNLVLLLLALFSLLGNIKAPGIRISIMNYLSWFIVLFFVGTYIRLYPHKFFSNVKFLFCSTISLLLLSCASIIFCWQNKWIDPYYFVSDSNMPLAFLLGVSLLLLFNTIRLPYNKFINTLAIGTFAVLLIHDHSAIMQRWLWHDILKITSYYKEPYAFLYYILVTIFIFVLCSTFDQIRIRFIERPLFTFQQKNVK